MRVGDARRGGERAKVFGAWKLGDELRGILDVESRSAAEHARGEVEVEAPLEALLYELGVRRDVPERRMLLRHNLTLLVLLLALLELGLLLGRPEVLLGRVVRLVVTGKSEFRCGHVHGVRSGGGVGGGPEGVEGGLLEGRRGGSGAAGDDAAGTNCADDLHDLECGR